MLKNWVVGVVLVLAAFTFTVTSGGDANADIGPRPKGQKTWRQRRAERERAKKNNTKKKTGTKKGGAKKAA